MIPNNNLSVLPWYRSLDEQNARRWWIYDRVYPLFAPALKLLPFQVMRDTLTTPHYAKGEALQYDLDFGILPNHYIRQTGDPDAVIEFVPELNSSLIKFSIVGQPYIWWEDIPDPPSGEGVVSAINLAIFDENDVCIWSYGTMVNQPLRVPEGASYCIVNTLVSPGVGPTAKIYGTDITYTTTPVSVFDIYTKEGTLVGHYIDQISQAGLTVKPFYSSGYDVIVFPALLPFLQSLPNGQYYAIMSDGTNTWYSEIFTAVNDIEPYLKITWWDTEDFVMDAGTIVYTNPSFKNVIYLDSALAKPEYPFEEEGESRDGYFFPIKQISEKRYRFAFFASEYLLDVMRFIRMADYAEVEWHGQKYSLDTFLITPEWEDNGDVASVEAQFDTATVAKKIGVGYVKAQRGDFNDDFNNDFNN